MRWVHQSAENRIKAGIRPGSHWGLRTFVPPVRDSQDTAHGRFRPVAGRRCPERPHAKADADIKVKARGRDVWTTGAWGPRVHSAGHRGTRRRFVVCCAPHHERGAQP